MPIALIQILLPFAVNLLTSYLKNKDTSRDELILDTVKKSCQYLASKDNNTMTYGHVASVGSVQYFGEE